MRIFDLHADLGWNIRRCRRAGETHVLSQHHLPYLQQGGVLNVTAASYFSGTESWQDMQEMILLVKDEVMNSDVAWIRRPEDLNAHLKKVSVLMSVEGMCGIRSNAAAKVDWMYQQGARIGSLCWNEGNALANGRDGAVGKGLSPLGREVIRQMNRRHMIVDVSHASEKTFWDIMDASRRPVIATHSNARALCNVDRNLTDQQIDALAARGGLIGMNACLRFIDPQEENQNALHLAMHARYIADRVGVEHVACGFDFMDFFPDHPIENDLSQAAQAQNFIAALRQVGFHENQIKAIAWGNVFRFLKENM